MISSISSLWQSSVMTRDTVPYHFYIEWSGKSVSDSINYRVGKLDWEKSKPIKNPYDDNSIDNMIQQIDFSLQSIAPEKSNILIHIHGLWANKKPFVEEINSTLDRHIYSSEDCPYGIIVNIIWDSGYIYDANKKVAYEKGQRSLELVTQLEKLCRGKNAKLSIMCHSMGNRVLQGMIDAADIPHRKIPIFDKCLMVAPDIESDVFEVSHSFEKSTLISNQIVVYRHNTDRTLGMSRLINNDRLGLNGITETANDFSNIRLVDASLLNDDEFQSAKFSRHRYYYSSPTVRRDILTELAGKSLSDSPKRELLNRKNHYKLIFD